MEISKDYKARHGIANFEKLTFEITSRNNPSVLCELLKVPTYTRKHSYHEQICDGNGWKVKGKRITENITYDSYWLIKKDGKCLGVIDEDSKLSYNFKREILHRLDNEVNKFIDSI